MASCQHLFLLQLPGDAPAPLLLSWGASGQEVPESTRGELTAPTSGCSEPAQGKILINSFFFFFLRLGLVQAHLGCTK